MREAAEKIETTVGDFGDLKARRLTSPLLRNVVAAEHPQADIGLWDGWMDRMVTNIDRLILGDLLDA